MKYTFFILIIMLSMFSCQKSLEGIQGDTIKLSTDKLFSPAEGGEFEVATEGKFWWVDRGISVDSKFYGFRCDSMCNNNYWSYNDIEFPIETNLKDFYDIVKIEGPWFTIHKVSEQKIIFTILPNDTEKDRTLILGLDAGNFGTSVTLTQSAN